jgi:uncharacterized repeat protein (TIGR01451 family)/CSLREA domain-containing protein
MRPAILVLSFALLAAPAAAGTLTVDLLADENDGAGCQVGDCSLREAIAASVAGDTIVFAPAVAGGSVTLTLGELVIGHHLTIDGGELGITLREGSPRLLRIDPGTIVVLSGLTMRGAAANPAGDPHGGAVYNQGELTLRDVVLRANASYSVPAGGAANGGDGGGVYNAAGATLVMERVVARQNVTGAGGGSGGTGLHAGRGGAVFNAGTLVVVDSTFRDNTTGDGLCSGNHGGDGGAIYNAGAATVTSTTFDRNLTGDGNVGCAGTTGTDGRGGAIYDAGVLAVNASTLTGNQTGSAAAGAEVGGGGAYVGPGGATRLRNVTVAENVAGGTAGGGVFRGGGGGLDADLWLKNSLVALNQAAGADADCGTSGAGALVSEGYNLVGIGGGCAGALGGTDQAGTAAAPLDPGLAPYAANGGLTDTYMPAAGSPAIDAANPDAAECDGYDAATGAETPFTADQRGQARPTDGDGTGGPVCDVGSVEVPEPVVADLSITKTDGVDAAVPGQPVTYVLEVANAGPDDAVGVTVTDLFPDTLACTWTCTAAGGASCSPGPVADDVDDTLALPAGTGATYTAECTIAVDAAGTLVNTAVVALPGGLPDPAPGDEIATDVDELLVDFGDAPASYGTLLAAAGGRHALAGDLRLGVAVDAEPDGQPSAGADADAGDDGVALVTTVDPGHQATVEVTASGPGLVSAWFDWNRDGDWADPGEGGLTNAAVAAGANQLQVAVPAGARVGITFARFRLAAAAVPGAGGAAADGEVEDYALQVGIFADGFESGGVGAWSAAAP